MWATHLNNTTPLFTIHIKLYCFLFFFFAQSGIAPSGAPAPVPATERREHQLQLAVYCKAQKKKQTWKAQHVPGPDAIIESASGGVRLVGSGCGADIISCADFIVLSWKILNISGFHRLSEQS